MSKTLEDKYPTHEGRVFLVQFFALINGLLAGTTTSAMVQNLKLNVVAAFRELCEEDAKKRDPDDPRVRKYGYLRIKQEDGHVATALHALSPWLQKDGDIGTAARGLDEVGQFMRAELKRTLAITEQQRSANYSPTLDGVLVLKLPSVDDEKLPDFLKDV